IQNFSKRGEVEERSSGLCRGQARSVHVNLTTRPLSLAKQLSPSVSVSVCLRLSVSLSLSLSLFLFLSLCQCLFLFFCLFLLLSLLSPVSLSGSVCPFPSLSLTVSLSPDKQRSPSVSVCFSSFVGLPPRKRRLPIGYAFPRAQSWMPIRRSSSRRQ